MCFSAKLEEDKRLKSIGFCRQDGFMSMELISQKSNRCRQALKRVTFSDEKGFRLII